MKVKEIHINNYRGMKRFKLSFAPKINVLIGRNGAGKSTLIHAIHKALSFMFSKDKSLGDYFISAGNDFLKTGKFDTNDFYFDEHKNEASQDLSISCKMDYDNEEVEWEMFQRNTGSSYPYPSHYKEAFKKIVGKLNQDGATWPVIAYYSDSFPHVYTRVAKQILDKINDNRLPRNFGYYDWDDETSCTSLWEVRLCSVISKMQPLSTLASRVAPVFLAFSSKYSKDELQNNEEYQRLKGEQDRILSKYNPLSKEVDFVANKVRTMLDYLEGSKKTDYQLDYFSSAQTDEGFLLMLHFLNGKSSLLQNLPAGYRRLISIVIDLACRSYILNGEKETCGIVMIDEVDLHLHPALEQNVIEALAKTFPEVQWIVSTHSVSVISNIDTSMSEGNRQNQILVMQDGSEDPEVLPNIFGIDYNAALRDFMDTPSSNDD